ncbi:hypothetical protein [Streptomyces sp. CBMAI 2042]|uniref:hypothetical protein n=1 Tax=Streptomyces sp. CBMAI 2042 TaxID=2305222 RepID=UPI001F25297F|nr:hypothetical protein [Streptomyces sp. CBMAI 2042]
MQIRIPGTDELPAPETSEQQELLQIIWDAFATRSEWPTFHWVDRRMDRQGLDAATALSQLPEGLIRGFPDLSRRLPPDDADLPLTIAGAAQCRGSADVVLLFLALIRVLAKTEQHWSGEDKPSLSAQAAVSRLGLMPIEEHTILLQQARLLAQFEPGVDGLHVAGNGVTWTLTVGRSIRPFREVEDIGAYWRERQILRTPHPVVPANSDQPAEEADVTVPRGPYISADLIEVLATTTTSFKLDKLTALARELNANVAAEHPYASQMLLRAILDHVPPAFEQATFDNVVANVSWSRTDKNYVKRLRDVRTSADDALHRQIRQSPSHLNMDDMPPRTWLNALLQRLVDHLSGAEQR